MRSQREIGGAGNGVWAMFLSTRNLFVLVAIAGLTWTFGAIADGGATAQAGPSRLAVIDVQRVLSQSNAGKASVERLTKLQQDRLVKAKTMDDELSRITNQLKAGTNLPAAQRTNLAKQIEDKRIAMKRFAEDAEKEVGQARERELLALESSIKPVVEGVGKEMGLAAIFNKYESGLIYAADSVDISDAVIKRFNEATIARPRP